MSATVETTSTADSSGGGHSIKQSSGEADKGMVETPKTSGRDTSLTDMNTSVSLAAVEARATGIAWGGN